MLSGAPYAFVNADVALDGEPVIGSFTVDGLTFAVTDDASVELVGVAEAEGAFGSEVPTSPQPPSASTPEAEGLVSEVDGSSLVLPGSVSYGDAEYSVASIGAYAFYLSGVTSVELPASVADVDERAFRSSDVSSVEVDPANASYSSFDGVLYDAGQSSLLLIPEGRLGAVRMPSTVMAALPSAFSHCAGVDAITVDADGAAFASENGLLYDASLTTLLRVPAGATDITIREGCTTIAAGAMEGCAKLSTITAPASVTSISPDVFTSVPTVSLPAASVAVDAEESSQADEVKGVFGSEVPTSPQPPSASLAEAPSPAGTQLTALVALSTTDDDLPEVDPAGITVYMASMESADAWTAFGFACQEGVPDVEAQEIPEVLTELAATYAANGVYGYAYPSDLRCRWTSTSNLKADPQIAGTPWRVYTWTNSNIPSALHNSSRGYHLQWSINKDQAYLLTPSDKIVYVPSYTWTPPANLPAASRPSTSLFVFYDTYKFTVTWDANGGEIEKDGAWTSQAADMVPILSNTVSCPTPRRAGYRFMGWNAGGTTYGAGDTVTVLGSMTLTAQWERVEYDIGFDVDSEPGDEDYPGIEKPDETVNVESGPTVIEDPKRPGYVFQGWVIPSEDGTTAIDQDLVYQDETDGKWYVDASKLPDYATDGRVELTARWTSVISVDVPSAVTFYADVVTQGNESREGAASSAFGQNKVASQSQVDLRIVGLESTVVETQGSTLGADSILKKATSVTPSSSAQKLFSLYPTSKALTADDLQDPDAVSAAKPTDAVDFALDDILLEKSFAADKFTIPAGGTLNLGYRLNLSETGTELDYEKLSTLDEGQSASIAIISYCFAADLPAGPFPTGTREDDLWVSNADESKAPVGIYGLADIKAAAIDLAACAARVGAGASAEEVGRAIADSDYYSFYQSMLDSGTAFKLKVVSNGIAGWYDVQLIGICQDRCANGAWAGLTFGFKDLWAYDGKNQAGAATTSMMNASGISTGSWEASDLRAYLRDDFYPSLGSGMRSPSTGIVELQKIHQAFGNPSLQTTEDETVFVPSVFEILGCATPYCTAESSDNSFQYQWFAKGGQSATNAYAVKMFEGLTGWWWTRSAFTGNNNRWNYMFMTGSYHYGYYENQNAGILPCFAL